MPDHGNRTSPQPEPSSLADARRCCICGTTEDLRIAPVMTGDRFGEEPKWPVCSECVRTWYEYGVTTAEGILKRRIGQVLALTYKPEGVDLWLAHAAKQGWSPAEQMQKAHAMAEGAFS